MNRTRGARRSAALAAVMMLLFGVGARGASSAGDPPPEPGCATFPAR